MVPGVRKQTSQHCRLGTLKVYYRARLLEPMERALGRAIAYERQAPSPSLLLTGAC